MGHRKSIIKESMERLDGLMAIGESRREAKQELRSEGQHVWAFSTGKMHSYKTRQTYQEHVLRFVNWARDTHHVKTLASLDEQSPALASQYLQLHIADGKSPYTLQTERAALRLFFHNRGLADDVILPRRTRSSITRSRGPVKHDSHFQPANWPHLVNFLRATGIRRQELRDLLVKDIYQDPAGQIFVHVRNGKGGKARDVPVLAGHDASVLGVVSGRDPDEHVFSRIPKHMDVHSYRREFAQALYLQHSPPGQLLPPASGRLRHADYNRAAAERVTWALGHNRIDVVLRHYIR